MQGKLSGFLEVRLFSAMLFNGRWKMTVDRPGSRWNTDIGTWERNRNALKLWCSRRISPIDTFDMPFVRHDHGVQCLRNM